MADPHIPAEWAEAAERVRHGSVRRLVVIGGVDVGKSTLCRFLLDEAERSGRSASLLDTDLGQKSIGPPACVTMSDRHGMSLSFVGTTNPILGWRRLINGVRHLAGQADAELVVANTSGLLAGPGRRLKAAKIEAIRPGLLIALSEGPDLEAILHDHREAAILRLPPSPHARRKTDGERRRARREAFRRYFAEARLQTVERGMLPQSEPEIPLPSGLLLGLADKRGCEQGIGILSGGSVETVDILTPVEGSVICRVTPGSLRLDEAFREVHGV